MPRLKERQQEPQKTKFEEGLFSQNSSLKSDEFFYRVSQRQSGERTLYESQAKEAEAIRTRNAERQVAEKLKATEGRLSGARLRNANRKGNVKPSGRSTEFNIFPKSN